MDERQRYARWDFFVSYTGADRAWAEWIAWQLDQAGYRVLIQAWHMVPGSNFAVSMQEGILRSERTLAVLSLSYLRSVYGQIEWQAAHRADPTGFTRKLIPVRVQDCPRPGMLETIVSIDLFGHAPEQARTELLRRISAAVAGHDRPRSEPVFPAPARAGASAQATTPTEQAPPVVEPVFPGAPAAPALPPVPPRFQPAWGGIQPVGTRRRTGATTRTAAVALLVLIGVGGFVLIRSWGDNSTSASRAPFTTASKPTGDGGTPSRALSATPSSSGATSLTQISTARDRLKGKPTGHNDYARFTVTKVYSQANVVEIVLSIDNLTAYPLDLYFNDAVQLQLVDGSPLTPDPDPFHRTLPSVINPSQRPVSGSLLFVGAEPVPAAATTVYLSFGRVWSTSGTGGPEPLQVGPILLAAA